MTNTTKNQKATTVDAIVAIIKDAETTSVSYSVLDDGSYEYTVKRVHTNDKADERTTTLTTYKTAKLAEISAINRADDERKRSKRDADAKAPLKVPSLNEFEASYASYRAKLADADKQARADITAKRAELRSKLAELDKLDKELDKRDAEREKYAHADKATKDKLDKAGAKRVYKASLTLARKHNLDTADGRDLIAKHADRARVSARLFKTSYVAYLDGALADLPTEFAALDKDLDAIATK